MDQYRTEVVVPPDRYVSLQLPARFPAGRATITVLSLERNHEDASTGELASDLDRDDIEWWEEFDEGSDPLPAG